MNRAFCIRQGSGHEVDLRTLPDIIGRGSLKHLLGQLSPLQIYQIYHAQLWHHIYSKFHIKNIFSPRALNLVDLHFFVTELQKKQNKNMFNTFTAERNKKYQQQRESQFSQLAEWKRRYTTEVQPGLVTRFHRRINGFAKKMEDDPFTLKEIKDVPVQNALQRNYDKSLNISKTNFRFKSEEDWNSIYPPIERIERQDIMKSYLSSGGKTNSILMLRNIGSQSKYGNFKVQYRSRCKTKEINPPMKYSNRNSQFMKQSYLPSLQESKKRKTALQTDASAKKNNTSSVVDSEDKQGQNFSHLDIDSFSVQNTFGMRSKNPEAMNKTQKQIIEQEEMKALAQKRLYFKSLVDLEQNVKTAKQRNNLKEILVKCGIFKPSSGKVYEEEEVDRFLEMMKTKQ